MKLVIFGLTISSSWGNGHATLWRALCAALGRRGHDVVFFERDVPYYSEFRDLIGVPGGGELVLYDDWASIRSTARRHLDEADAGLVTSYCPDALGATELIKDSAARLAVFYDLDTPVTLDRLDAGEAVNYIGPSGLRDYDLVLSYTGGKALDELGRRLGARRVATLYGSVDPDVHRPAEPDPCFAADLSYLGTYAADRQPTLEALLIEPARRLPDQRFLIGGAQYPSEFPWAPNVYFVRHVDPPQHPSFYSSTRITLNVTRKAMKEMGYCPSGRLFEAAACGAPIVSDSWEGLDAFFEPESEILVATSTEESIAALELDSEVLQAIGARARERALDQHTADCRARELEDAFEDALRHAPDKEVRTSSSNLAEIE